MRRGLISWSKTELPASVLDARVKRAQAAMGAAGVDALAIYSDPARTAGASWLTGFVPYWNRGVVVLPRDGNPMLLTGMSKRVHGWIQKNSHLEEVAYSTSIGTDVAARVSARKGAVVAVPDIGSVPGGILDGIAGDGVSVVDGTQLLAGLRTVPDPSELSFAFKAATLARVALARATAIESDAATLVGLVDGEARRLGAEEVYVALAPDLARGTSLVRLEGTAALGTSFALRLSLAYKGVWVRMTRTLARDESVAAEIAAATERFAATVALLPRLDALDDLPYWLVEGCRTLMPLQPLAGSMLPDRLALAPGSYVSVQARIDTTHGPALIGAPVLLGRDGDTAALMASPLFET